jgi:ATP-dependent 26S proteasome regulatory subunit
MSATYLSDFSKELNHKRRAGFGCIVVPSREQQAAESEIYNAMFDPTSNHHPTQVFSWSCASGIKKMVDATTHEPLNESNLRNDILDMLVEMPDWLPEEPSVIIMNDVYPFVDTPMIRRLLLERIHYCRYAKHFIIILQRGSELHSDFNDEISVLRHSLPSREATEQMANAFLTQVDKETKQPWYPAISEKGVDNLMGLTAMGQTNAVTLAIIEAKENNRENISIDLLRKHKEAEIGKREYLKISEPTVTFDNIVGNDLLKQWVNKRALAYTKDARDSGLRSPLGIMMAGPPGSGKTRLAEAIAAFLGVPFAFVDIGLLFGGLLGESEHNAEDVIQTLEAMAPCVALFDEVERAFGSKGGDTDGGTTDRVIGKFLTWLSTKTSDVFCVFTANNVENLPAAMIRKGRLDQIFCVDLPIPTERKAIWEYFLNKRNHKISDASIKELVERSNGWVGSEIEAVVEEANFTAYADGKRPIKVGDLLEEADLFTPVSVSMEQQVTHMREWARKNARPTNVREDKTTKTARNML